MYIKTTGQQQKFVAQWLDSKGIRHRKEFTGRRAARRYELAQRGLASILRGTALLHQATHHRKKPAHTAILAIQRAAEEAVSKTA